MNCCHFQRLFAFQVPETIIVILGSCSCSCSCIFVYFQFYPWFNFDFPLLFSMLIYDNEYQTKENQIEPNIKLNYNECEGLQI